MKTSSPYPVLDNRPIDQWKVTELKEELKRRKLTTKGLKDDLIKRLDEAIRIEREDAEQVDNGIDDPEAEIADEASKTAVAGAETGEAGKVVPVNAEETMGNDDGKDSKMDDVSVQGDIKASAEQSIQNKSLEEKELELVNDQPPQVEILPASQDKSLEEKESELVNDQPPEVGILSATEEPPELEILPVSQAKSLEEKESELVNDQPPKVEVLSATEVPSAGVGDKVCEGLSSETVTSEPGFEDDKMERDNDDSRAQQGSEDIKPSDVDVKLDTSDPNNQKNHSADLGSSEKLNLDRSSGDDSMEEDALESKQIDSNYNSEEVGERTKKFEVTNMKEEGSFAAMDTDLPAEEKSIPENKDVAAASSDKRKLPEQGTVLSHEPSKRQRRWKSESNKVGDPHISNTPPAATKDVAEPAVLKRNFSRSDSVGANDTAKEREVPPSAKAATNSLRIDRFLRPFTLKAVQELLAKTGTVTSFWMDHIKTHCYVTYSSVEEAVDTRNVVYNLQWPPNGGRHLVAEFVDPEEVKSRVEVPPPQPPVAPAAPEPPPTLPQPSPRQQNLKQQMSQQPTLPPPPPLSNPAPAREFTHLPPPPPPPPQEKVEAPIVTLDDLFRKTKTTPRIYYLPLSEEQVSAVLEERRKNSRQ